MNSLGKLFLQGLAVIIPVSLTLAILWWMAVSAERFDDHFDRVLRELAADREAQALSAARRQAARRSASLMAEWSTAGGNSKRSLNRSTSCGVRPISGTSTRA